MSVTSSIARRVLALAAVAGVAAAATVPTVAAAAPERAYSPLTPRATAGSIAFGGLTGQDWPVVMAISPNAKRLRLAVIGLQMSCTSGGSFAVNDAFGNLPIARSGKVHASRGIPTFATANVTLTGGSHSMTATLHRRQARFTGTWHLHLDYALANGQTDHCDSGVVRFSAVL